MTRAAMTVAATASPAASHPQRETLFGHPSGLFTLFFAEMWERFSYYGMRALLVFYMIKGFLAATDNKAYGIYAAYTALVYATPFIGGILADRLLGARRAVILGGLLMAAGHLLMTVENELAFFSALALLICGNGFFKPNISTIVGSLYPADSPRRDGGFTVFYMGINLGAAMSPILCGYVGETYGWHYGFGLATMGMLVGVAVFAAPRRVTQFAIMAAALAASVGMPFLQDSTLQLSVRLLLSVALTTAAIVAFFALNRGGLPERAGAPPDATKLARKLGGFLRADLAVYLGTLLMVPVFALLVRGQSWAGWVVGIFGGAALLWLFYHSIKLEKVARERMFVIYILMFFCMLFWAFFELAGSAINNFTDRNVDRVFEARRLTEADVGTTIPNLKLTQEQFGQLADGQVMTMTTVQHAREAHADVVPWRVIPENVGMGVGGAEIPASEFQAANPIFILIFGLLFTMAWGYLGKRRLEPSTPFKFALGMLQLGAGFAVLWYAVQHADARGMVGMEWLLLAYLLHTTGELCLSPVGLSMITKLAPPRLVSTVMGGWFLATAFSNTLSGVIAMATGVGGEEGEPLSVPPPVETVNLYGDVFGYVAFAAFVATVVCFALVPLLKKWMHGVE